MKKGTKESNQNNNSEEGERFVRQQPVPRIGPIEETIAGIVGR
jgi:hypothetical protein